MVESCFRPLLPTSMHGTALPDGHPMVIRGREAPLAASGGTAILYGSLAPDGAVIKSVAADRRFWRHTGPAVVFRSYEDLDARSTEAIRSVASSSRAPSPSCSNNAMRTGVRVTKASAC